MHMRNFKRMKKLYSRIVEEYFIKYLKKVPGEEKFGIYRFLPLFFVFGASLEYLMIHLKAGPGKVNFCKRYLNWFENNLNFFVNL